MNTYYNSVFISCKSRKKSQKTCSFLGGVNSCQILNVFFLFLRIVPGKVLAKGRGESQEHLMSNESRVSIYDYGFHTVTIRINSNFEAGIPGLHSWEKTYIAFQYHLQRTNYIFKECEQFAKFFLH